MSAIESDPGWYARMAARTAARQLEHPPSVAESTMTTEARIEIDRFRRSQWPVPPQLRGFSARDVFLWYICDGWRRIFGDDHPVEQLLNHDFGLHILRKGTWQLTLVDLEQFPDRRFPQPQPDGPDGDPNDDPDPGGPSDPGDGIDGMDGVHLLAGFEKGIATVVSDTKRIASYALALSESPESPGSPESLESPESPELCVSPDPLSADHPDDPATGGSR